MVCEWRSGAVPGSAGVPPAAGHRLATWASGRDPRASRRPPSLPGPRLVRGSGRLGHVVSVVALRAFGPLRAGRPRSQVAPRPVLGVVHEARTSARCGRDGPGAAPCRSRQPRGECHPERNGRYRPPSNGQAPERHGPRLHPDGADRGHPGAPGAALTSARSPWRAGHRPHQRAPTLSSMPCAGAVSSLCRRVALTPTEKPEGLAAGARRQPRL